MHYKKNAGRCCRFSPLSADRLTTCDAQVVKETLLSFLSFFVRFGMFAKRAPRTVKIISSLDDVDYAVPPHLCVKENWALGSAHGPPDVDGVSSLNIPTRVGSAPTNHPAWL